MAFRTELSLWLSSLMYWLYSVVVLITCTPTYIRLSCAMLNNKHNNYMYACSTHWYIKCKRNVITIFKENFTELPHLTTNRSAPSYNHPSAASKFHLQLLKPVRYSYPCIVVSLSVPISASWRSRPASSVKTLPSTIARQETLVHSYGCFWAGPANWRHLHNVMSKINLILYRSLVKLYIRLSTCIKQ